MNDWMTGFAAIALTVVLYNGAVFVYQRYRRTWTAPIILATAVLILLLILFGVSYDTYMIGGKWIDHMLGPAVVSLAYPLYQYRKTLSKVLVPVCTGIGTGAVIGISSGLLLSKWAGFSKLIIYSVIPKSVTTPVSMAVTETLGGAEPLAAVFVMIAGIGGVLISPLVMKMAGITNPIGRGVGMGSACHAIGTATAMEHDQLEGSLSTIAMVLSAVIVSIIAPGLTVILLGL